MVLEGQHYKRLCQGRRTFSWPHPPAKEKYQPVSLHSKQVGGCGKERQVVQLFRTPPPVSTGLLGWQESGEAGHAHLAPSP